MRRWRHPAAALVAVTTDESLSTLVARGDARRGVTTQGQFNPLHRFLFHRDTAVPSNLGIAKDEKEFKRMISNPGPLRPSFSADYVDWYYRAYKERVQYALRQVRIRQRFPWTSPRKDAGVDAVAVDTGVDLPAQGLKPFTSPSRQAGEKGMDQALETIDRAVIEQGSFDLLERLPQFPQLHIDRASDFHVREIIKQHFVDQALSVDQLWRRALILRAILLEKKATYPRSFEYIFRHVESCKFAQREKPTAESEKVLTPEFDAPYGPEANLMPTQDHMQYYQYLVRRYHVENSVDAHVLLECHLLPDAEAVLMCEPPPREDIKDAQGRPVVFPLVAPRTPLPSEEALYDAANLPLMRCLIFGEFNLAVSTDPFTKYPKASLYVTKPNSLELRDLVANRSLEERLEERRNPLLPKLIKPQTAALVGRSKDVQRLQSLYFKRDAMFVQEIGRLADEQPAAWGPTNSPFYNHRTVRAELRDRAARRLLRGLRDYRQQRKETFPEATFDECEDSWRGRGQWPDLPAYHPTVPFFLRGILKDAHVSFLLSVMGGLERHASLVGKLRSSCLNLASEMFQMALEYHVRESRAIHRQAMLVAAALLDTVVEEAIAVVKSDSAFAAPQVDDVSGSAAGQQLTAAVLGDTVQRKLMMHVGTWVPFASRPLDRHGFPNAARSDDLFRWLSAAPAMPSRKK